MSADGTPSGRANAPFSGYYNRPADPKPDPLTQVGPGTPAGEYLRRFWHPFLLSSELGVLPKVIKVLGEELVVFRDGSGCIGLVHKHCVHRGVSLEFGIVGQRGITCCYHGWKYDVDGTILETPAEPANSKIKERFSLGAYPVIEEHGMIFTYMGPPELKPEFPRYDCYNYPSPNKLVPLKMEVPCNWLQVHENACDPAHTTYLHAVVSAAQFERTFTALPALDFIPTPLGFAAPATRRLKDMVFIRTNDLIMPNIVQVTGSKGLGLEESYMVAALLTRWATPADDTNTYYIGYVHENAITGNESKRSLTTPVGLNRMNLIGQTPYRPYEERQIEPGDYDAMISPGPIANRAAEHLASTDGGVALFRRMLAREIARVERGEEPEYPKVRTKEPVRTYCYSASMKIGNAKIEGMDGLHDFGKRVTQLVIDSADVAPEERERICEERTRALLTGSAS